MDSPRAPQKRELQCESGLEGGGIKSVAFICSHRAHAVRSFGKPPFRTAGKSGGGRGASRLGARAESAFGYYYLSAGFFASEKNIFCRYETLYTKSIQKMRAHTIIPYVHIENVMRA